MDINALDSFIMKAITWLCLFDFAEIIILSTLSVIIVIITKLPQALCMTKYDFFQNNTTLDTHGSKNDRQLLITCNLIMWLESSSIFFLTNSEILKKKPSPLKYTSTITLGDSEHKAPTS